MQKIIIGLILCLFISACSYLVEINMALRDETPVFAFKYRGSHAPVKLASIHVRKSETGELVWNIGSIDASQLVKKKDGKLIVNYTSPLLKQVTAVEMASLTFGIVPDGFKQFYPTDQEKPTLQKNTNYTINMSGEGSGLLTFIVPL